MDAKVKVDAGICGFKTIITATSEDSMNVDLKVVSPCEIIKGLAAQYKEICPINAYQDIGPKSESQILNISRKVLVEKGACEACVVPTAVCKAMYVAAGLALPKDIKIEIKQ
ncbi:MAG: hypothetical protein LJE94_04265 [Deltaproteobacteria bacterium]|jgi:hypothetical protein|nr:hypothetical protein [Deltaproteobacteria bacterium]